MSTFLWNPESVILFKQQQQLEPVYVEPNGQAVSAAIYLSI